MLRTYPIDPTDADLVAAANAESIPVATAARELAKIPRAEMNGMLAHIRAPENWGLSTDDWRAAFSVLSGYGDPAVRFVMRLLAAKTGAVVFDPGT